MALNEDEPLVGEKLRAADLMDENSATLNCQHGFAARVTTEAVILPNKSKHTACSPLPTAPGRIVVASFAH